MSRYLDLARQERVYAPIHEQRPEMVILPANLLNIDRSYQREADMGRVRRYAARWDWAAAGTIDVSRRVDGPRAGEYFIYDGQHRWLGAQLAYNDEAVEMLALLSHLTRDEEAIRFADQHRDEVRVTRPSQVRALLEAHDPLVTHMQQIVEGEGYTLNLTNSGHAGAGSLRAVATLLRLYIGRGPANLAQTLHIIAIAWTRHPKATENEVLGGVSHFLYYFPVVPARELAEKLSVKSLSELKTEADFYGSGKHGEKAISRAILDVWNWKKREPNRLEWDLTKYRKIAALTAKGGA